MDFNYSWKSATETSVRLSGDCGGPGVVLGSRAEWEHTTGGGTAALKEPVRSANTQAIRAWNDVRGRSLLNAGGSSGHGGGSG
jgi:hypothetical protein